MRLCRNAIVRPSSRSASRIEPPAPDLQSAVSPSTARSDSIQPAPSTAAQFSATPPSSSDALPPGVGPPPPGTALMPDPAPAPVPHGASPAAAPPAPPLPPAGQLPAVCTETQTQHSQRRPTDDLVPHPAVNCGRLVSLELRRHARDCLLGGVPDLFDGHLWNTAHARRWIDPFIAAWHNRAAPAWGLDRVVARRERVHA